MAHLVFASDSHLNRRYARMSPDQLADRRARLRAAWKQSVDFAIEQGADVYLHGGDLYDSPNPRAAELVWTAGEFQRLRDAGVRAMLIGGNHDVPKTRLQGDTPQRLFDAVRLATVFTSSSAVTWHALEIRGTRIAVGGLPPDPRLGPDDDPLSSLQAPIAPPPADLVVLITHYAVEGLLHPLAEEAVIRRSTIGDLSDRVDVLLVGHLHEGHDLDVGGVRVIFPGPTERLSFGELDARPGFLSLRITGTRPCDVRVRHVAIAPQPMRREIVRAADLPADDPTAHLIGLVRTLSHPDQILQLRLDGPLARETYQALRFLDVQDVGRASNFYFDLDRHRLTVSAGPQVTPSTTAHRGIRPRDEIAAVADALAREAASEPNRALIEEARGLALERYGSPDIEQE